MKQEELNSILENAGKQLEINYQQAQELENDLALKNAEIQSGLFFINTLENRKEVPHVK